MHLIELHLHCGSRQRAVAPLSVEGAADDAQRDIVGMLIDQAQAQLAASLRNAESHDTKALGLLAVEVASVLALLDRHAALNRFWPSLLVGACLSMAAVCVTLWSRAFRLGPAIDPLYEEFIDRPALDASIAILDVLNQSIVDNQTIIEVKKRAWVIGAVIMFCHRGCGRHLPARGALRWRTCASPRRATSTRYPTAETIASGRRLPSFRTGAT